MATARSVVIAAVLSLTMILPAAASSDSFSCEQYLSFDDDERVSISVGFFMGLAMARDFSHAAAIAWEKEGSVVGKIMREIDNEFIGMILDSKRGTVLSFQKHWEAECLEDKSSVAFDALSRVVATQFFIEADR